MPNNLTTTINVIVNSALSFTPANLPVGTVGTAYPSTSIGAVSGGTAPYKFTATGLPPGMVLGTDGTLAGTPTASGTYESTVEITDSSP